MPSKPQARTTTSGCSAAPTPKTASTPTRFADAPPACHQAPPNDSKPGRTDADSGCLPRSSIQLDSLLIDVSAHGDGTARSGSGDVAADAHIWPRRLGFFVSPLCPGSRSGVPRV
jgi:hypothetical protein